MGFIFAAIEAPWDAAIYYTIGIPSSIAAAVFYCLILHRGWAAVQDGQARTTPGKAVGFGFVPFFNLYWVFVSHYGLLKEFNRAATTYARPGAQVTAGFGLTLSILSVIPYVNIFALPFTIVFVWQILGAVRDLEKA